MTFKLKSQGSSFKMMGSSPAKNHIVDKSGRPIPHWESTPKYRKDGTLKKVVTKAKRGSGNKESRSRLQGVLGKNNYKSVIKFDEEGRIESARNNRTKNKDKKAVQRLSRSKWIERDLTPYTEYTTIPKKKKKYDPEKDPNAVTWKKVVAKHRIQ